MNSALDDLIVIIEYLAATKTLPNNAAEAMARLKSRSQHKIPVDIRLGPNEADDSSA